MNEIVNNIFRDIKLIYVVLVRSCLSFFNFIFSCEELFLFLHQINLVVVINKSLIVKYKVCWISLDLEIILVCKILKRQATMDYKIIFLELSKLKPINK